MLRIDTLRNLPLTHVHFNTALETMKSTGFLLTASPYLFHSLLLCPDDSLADATKWTKLLRLWEILHTASLALASNALCSLGPTRRPVGTLSFSSPLSD